MSCIIPCVTWGCVGPTMRCYHLTKYFPVLSKTWRFAISFSFCHIFFANVMTSKARPTPATGWLYTLVSYIFFLFLPNSPPPPPFQRKPRRPYGFARSCRAASLYTPLYSPARWRVRSRTAPPPGLCPGVSTRGFPADCSSPLCVCAAYQI
jgi:hypothetical protein